MEQQEKKEQQIQIEIDDVTAQGVYSNLAIITHSPDEFILDFIFIQPQIPKAKVRTRVITSPQHVKRFFYALQDNIKKYEEKFGEIKVEPRPELPKIGFVH